MRFIIARDFEDLGIRTVSPQAFAIKQVHFERQQCIHRAEPERLIVLEQIDARRHQRADLQIEPGGQLGSIGNSDLRPNERQRKQPEENWAPAWHGRILSLGLVSALPFPGGRSCFLRSTKTRGSPPQYGVVPRYRFVVTTWNLPI